MIKRAISEQLIHPRGIIGRYLLPVVWNKRNRALNDFTLSRLRPEPEDNILEIGFGGGYLIERMIEKVATGHIIGIDPSENLLAYCQGRFAHPISAGKLGLLLATVETLPCSDGRFSKVCSVNSIFYWSNLRQGMQEIYRVLAPNGLFILTYTCKQDLERRGFCPHAVRSFTDKEVTDALQEKRFTSVFLEKGEDKFRRFSCVTARK